MMEDLNVEADVSLIEDERFDFDLPVSPDSRDEDVCQVDEDEVFFGPVGHKERCVATNTDFTEKLNGDEQSSPTPPLNAKHFVELYKEANFVAHLIEKQSITDNPEEGKDLEGNTHNEKENQEIGFIRVHNKHVNGIGRNESVAGKGALQEKFQTPPSKAAQSARLESSATKVTRSPRETKLQTPSRTQRIFSPVKVDHLYGLVNSPPKTDTKETQPENEKRTKQSQRALRPPGFGIQRLRRTSSSSSMSSTSSTSSVHSHNLNETFVLRRNSSSSSQRPSSSSSSTTALARKAVKSTLKSLGNEKPKFARPSDKSKTGGKPPPVKALPRAKPHSKASLGTPVRGSSSNSDGSTSAVGAAVRRRGSIKSSDSEVFTPVKRKGSSQFGYGTPSKGPNHGAATAGSPSKRHGGESTGQQRSKKGGLGTFAVKRRESGVTQLGATRGSAATPSRRGVASETNQSPSAKGRPLPRNSTTTKNQQMAPADVTPTQPKDQKAVQKRKSLSTGPHKRRSLLPTPVSSRATSHSQSRHSYVGVAHTSAPGPIPFNMSPTVTAKLHSALQRDSVSSEPNPLSPVPRSSEGHNDATENLIALSPAISLQEGDLIYLGSSPVCAVGNLVCLGGSPACTVPKLVDI